MKIKFCGAARGVTGSNYLIETNNGERFLVDCGMFQGSSFEERKNARRFAYNPAEIDFLILTHAHIDHCGRIPKLVKEGFSGDIHCTRATCDLSEVMLYDSAHIQYYDTQWENKKRQRAGQEPVAPLYLEEDVTASLRLFRGHYYGEMLTLTPHIRIRFRDAGHILGSAAVEVWVEEDEEVTKVVFSGDLGMPDRVLLKDPDYIDSADFVLMESTYGDREHESYEQSLQDLIDAIHKTTDRGGTAIIPSFSVGRTQELLYEMNKYYEYGGHNRKKIPPIYVDSPMAVKATGVFMHHTDIMDEEVAALVAQGDNIFNFPNLHYVKTTEESKELNFDSQPKVIISASGMCTGGRVRHHLKYNLWNPLNSVIFVGYQAKGTLGRLILEGEVDKVKIAGAWVDIRAQVYNLGGFSAHADRPHLLDWLAHYTDKPQRVFLVHGEPDQSQALAGHIKERFGVEVSIPSENDVLDLTKTGWELQKKTVMPEPNVEEISRLMEEVGRLMGSWEDRPHGLQELTPEQLEELQGTLYQVKGNIMDLNMLTGD